MQTDLATINDTNELSTHTNITQLTPTPPAAFTYENKRALCKDLKTASALVFAIQAITDNTIERDHDPVDAIEKISQLSEITADNLNKLAGLLDELPPIS